MPHTPTHQSEEQRQAALSASELSSVERGAVRAGIPAPDAITAGALAPAVAPVVTAPEIPLVPTVPPPDKEVAAPPTPTSTDALFGEIESAISGVSGFDRGAEIAQLTESQTRQLRDINKKLISKDLRQIQKNTEERLSLNKNEIEDLRLEIDKKDKDIKNIESNLRFFLVGLIRKKTVKQIVNKNAGYLVMQEMPKNIDPIIVYL